jgi:NAD(P)-dependent dehydrogenase (short-subunit alcohol dehydrogenase family)
VKLAIITGTTHGIGRVTSRELAGAGYTVVMLCRNTALAQRTRIELIAAVPGAELHVRHCDLAALASVRDCAAGLRREFGDVALFINNAGMVSTRHRRSADGYELTFATNHLGPFLLTRLLLDRMRPDGRIVNLASRVHYRGRLDLAQVDDPRARYRATAAYAQSKLANVMFTLALARRLAGSGITVNCLHPGVVASSLLPRWLQLVKPLISREILDVERGARTTLFLALSDQVAGLSGHYFDEHQHAQAPAALAQDLGLQEALWAASERWTREPGTPPLPH